MIEKSTNYSGCIGFCGLLAILFIGLKLTEISVVATWSWWWVLSPIWIPWLIGGVILIAIGIIYIIKE